MYQYTIDIQNEVGIGNTIWAIKKKAQEANESQEANEADHNNEINWEYYFYGVPNKQSADVSFLPLYSFAPRLSLKNYYKCNTTCIPTTNT